MDQSFFISKKTASLQSQLEATPGFEPGVKVLQTSALPLGYVAILRRDPSESLLCLG